MCAVCQQRDDVRCVNGFAWRRARHSAVERSSQERATCRAAAKATDTHKFANYHRRRQLGRFICEARLSLRRHELHVRGGHSHRKTQREPLPDSYSAPPRGRNTSTVQGSTRANSPDHRQPRHSRGQILSARIVPRRSSAISRQPASCSAASCSAAGRLRRARAEHRARMAPRATGDQS